MQDKSFEEAMRELNARTARELYELLQSHSPAVAENTVKSVVADIEDEKKRAIVADLLCRNKIVVLLSSLVNMGLHKREEMQELEDYIDQLRKRAGLPYDDSGT